ncbi:MAG: hypothetical protein EOO03_12890 [Chitinophagaceae bacterium]|nr:MAG: hypothetical protein EOO03_12890 [Chitinophagaceae bacterium]
MLFFFAAAANQFLQLYTANYNQKARQQAQKRATWLLWALTVFYVLMSLFLMLSDHITDQSIIQWA